MPVTSPMLETVAVVGADELQLTLCPLTTLPLASSGVAESWTVVPATIVGEGGVTLTEVTVGGGGVVLVAPLEQPADARAMRTEQWYRHTGRRDTHCSWPSG